MDSNRINVIDINRMKVIKSVDYSKYNRENPKCYEKCKKAYK